MSGFDRPGTYSLTRTKAEYWHRHRTECACRSLEEIVAEHLGAFTVRHRGNYVEVSGPGLDRRSIEALYLAVSGSAGYL